MSRETTQNLAMSAIVVTYCDGIDSNASTKGALNMITLGCRVKELIGGRDWWKRDGHKTEGSSAEGSPAGSESFRVVVQGRTLTTLGVT